MRLGRYLASLTRPELEELKEDLNLTEEELKVFEMLSKGRSNVQIAIDCCVATSTVSNRIKDISNKINKIRGW